MPLHAHKLSALLCSTVIVQPLIDHGFVIWGNCGHSLLMNVHKMMKRVIMKVKDRRQISHKKTGDRYHINSDNIPDLTSSINNGRAKIRWNNMTDNDINKYCMLTEGCLHDIHVPTEAV